MSAIPALRTRGVIKRYGALTAVDGVDMEVAAGEVVALLGPSGCGKSTLLQLLAGLQTPDNGSIFIGERLVADSGIWVPPQHRRVGVVFQDHALFPHLTVAQNIAFGITSLSRGEREARISEMLELVRLGAHRDRYPHELSGGESQRVSLARALAPSPVALLLDEPFASLDPELRDDLRAEVADLLRAANVAAVLVTHDHVDALVVADRIASMRAGRFVQVGTPQELHDRPCDLGVARAFGDINVFPVDGSAEGPRCALGPVDNAHVLAWPDGPVVAVRPYELVATNESPHGHDDLRQDEPRTVRATITATRFVGSFWRITALLEGSEQVVLVDHPRDKPLPSTHVRIGFDPRVTTHGRTQ